jgi:Flp pilus assembly protein TadG
VRTINPPRCRTRRPRPGAAAAELAIILPLLITIALGCVDFGRFAYSYIALTNAVRAGASYAMMNNYSASTYNTWVAGITTAAQQEMTNQIGYSSSNLTVSAPVVTVETSGLRRVQLTVSYPFQTTISWVFGGYFVPHSVSMTRAVTVRLIR